jgi:hypothetical protein
MTTPSAPGKLGRLSTRTSWWFLIAILGTVGMAWGLLIAWRQSNEPFYPVYWVGIEHGPPSGRGAEVHLYVFDIQVYSRKCNRLDEFQNQQAIFDSIPYVTLGLVGFGVGALTARPVLGSFRRFSSESSLQKTEKKMEGKGDAARS